MSCSHRVLLLAIGGLVAACGGASDDAPPTPARVAAPAAPDAAADPGPGQTAPRPPPSRRAEGPPEIDIPRAIEQRVHEAQGAGDANDANLRALDALEEEAPRADFELIDKDRVWFELLQAVPVGTGVLIAESGDDGLEHLRNVGFAAGLQGLFTRQADLLTPGEALVLSGPEQLGGADCIAVLLREEGPEAIDALYATVASLLAVLAPDVAINVLVAGRPPAQLSAERRGERLGAAAARVHLFGAPDAVDHYLREHLPAQRRAAWSYARTLLAYGGERGLIVLQHDVDWSMDAWGRVAAEIARARLPAVGLWSAAGPTAAPARPAIAALSAEHFDFSGLDAMLYPPRVAGVLGRYLQLRMHLGSCSEVVQLFFAHNEMTIGRASPAVSRRRERPAAEPAGQQDFVP